MTSEQPVATAPSVSELSAQIENNLKYQLCVALSAATESDIFNAVALTVRHYQYDDFLITQQRQRAEKETSLLFVDGVLLGQSLRNNLINIGLLTNMQRAVTELGFDFERIIDEEPDAALGNGGLGRLAACFIDSMATLDIAASGTASNTSMGSSNRRSTTAGKSNSRMTGTLILPANSGHATK